MRFETDRERNRRERAAASFLYVVDAPSVGLAKIGCTVNIPTRMMGLATSSPVTLRLRAKWQGTPQDEQRLHERFVAVRSHGEWFHLCPEIEALIAANPCDDLFPILSGRRGEALAAYQAKKKLTPS